jgi:fido (protein-threonine AMPylation protein)
MGLDVEYMDVKTPIDEEEKEALLIPAIAARGELDEFEQQNIEQGVQWTLGHAFKSDTVFTEEFVGMMHTRVYAEVWAWEGEFRKTNMDNGIEKWKTWRWNPGYPRGVSRWGDPLLFGPKAERTMLGD